MASKKNPTPSANKSISISGDVKDSAVIIGDNNTVNQTFVQKFFNIFKSDSETLEHRNRRILLGHVENAWIKGVLDASLHGAALLDLGIKQDPEAVTKYPWAIKKESTNETLPAGTSMLEIFDSIGMGRSLLILGAPGSGKTTMLLELARQLIARAREDVAYPIPMVFNLASWTEKLNLADWLAQELNNLYSVPRKTAPDWVKEDKLLLLLDGLDEVRQESRAKCVEAINAFRKEHGLTSLAVCSRSRDYSDLNAKLSFEGAIEVQPLTQKQITEFFNRFGDAMVGIMQAFEKDKVLREMAEPPLFLSIMLLAYRDKWDVEILALGDEKARRKHLFDTYIERMFEHPRTANGAFKKQWVLFWLSWLAGRMVAHNETSCYLENIQPDWLLQQNQHNQYMRIGYLFGFVDDEITTVDDVSWSWVGARDGLITGLVSIPFFLLIFLVVFILFFGLGKLIFGHNVIPLVDWLVLGLVFGLVGTSFGGLMGGLKSIKQMDQIDYPGQRLVFTTKNFLFSSLLFGLVGGLIIGLFYGLVIGLLVGLLVGLFNGWAFYGGISLTEHYTLRFILARNNLLPWRLVPFLNHCVDLIFLRRVGGGYIFVHRLLMEHFAEMYAEDNA